MRLLFPLIFVVACGAEDPPEGPRVTPKDAANIGVDAQADAGLQDAQIADLGAPDAETADLGPADLGAADADPADMGATDMGAADAGIATACQPSNQTTPGERYDALVRCLRDPNFSAAVKDQALQTFVQVIEGSVGFPIIDGNRVIFVYIRRAEYDLNDDTNTDEDFDLGRRNEPLRVSGDFVNWEAAGLPMTRDGDVFHLAANLDVAQSDRWRYKFVAEGPSGAVWFSDPLSRRFDYDGFGRISIVLGGRTQGHLEWIRNVRARQLGVDRLIYLYMPRGYDQGPNTYPVLYMHDGNNLFSRNQPFSAAAGSWEVDLVMENELSANRIRPGIVVGIPNNANRFGEYTHVQDDIGGGLTGGDGDAYADFIVNDLKPVVDGRYRTRPGRESTGILGSSLGGLISFYIGLIHPDVFRFVGGMSSTLGWGRYDGNNLTVIELYQQVANLDARDQIYYLDSGGAAPGGGCTSPFSGGSDNYCVGLALRDALIAQGVDTQPIDANANPLTPADIDLYYFHAQGAPHNEGAWNARMFRPLRLFLRP